MTFLQEAELSTNAHVDLTARFLGRHYVIFMSTAKGQSSGTAVNVRKGRGINVYPAIKTDMNERSCGVEVIY